MFVRVSLLVGMIGASVYSAIDPAFHFSEFDRQTKAACHMCYGPDCFEMDQARCQYYIKTDSILHKKLEEKVDNPDIRAEVDNLMYMIMEKADELATECIPLISKYTDCSKENICTGCRSCECDVTGQWNCSIVKKCQADPYLNINHKVLEEVINNLINNIQSKRFKRSALEKPKINPNKLSFEEISEWLYGSKVLSSQARETTPAPTSNVTDNKLANEPLMKIEYTATNNVATSTQNIDTEHDYLAFDEVLNSIAVESKIYSRKKPELDENDDTTPFDYMIFNEYNETTERFGFKSTDKILNAANNTNTENEMTEFYDKGETEVIIDLLEKYKNSKIASVHNNTDDIEFNDKINYLDPIIENNNKFELNTVNIMKRDIARYNNSDLQLHANNETSTMEELKQDVLLPLSNLINAKQKELEELLRISENLIKYMKSNKSEYIDTNIDRNTENIESNSTFNIYKLEILPEFNYEYDLRQTNTNILEQLLYKLKRDVHEVIRDIVGIKVYRNLTKLPQDLKILISAMKNYVRSEKNYVREDNEKIEESENKYSRRHLDYINSPYLKTIIDGIVKVIEIINKNKRNTNALASLSDTSKKIVNRIVKQNYQDELSENGLRAIDKNYNMTDDLQTIGRGWKEITRYVTNSSIFDELYAMKLIYLTLSVDIEKMNDALASINFVQNRRATILDGQMSYGIIKKINKGLKTINDRVKILIELQKQGLESSNSTKAYDFRSKIKKQSFFKKIKDMLKISKKDIVNILRKKVPRTNLLKELAKKKHDDIVRRRLTEFEETMKKWQSDLKIVPRARRSLREQKFKKRIKNIIPKYLRGKVDPALAANNLKKNNIKQKIFKTTAKTTPKAILKIKNFSNRKLN